MEHRKQKDGDENPRAEQHPWRTAPPRACFRGLAPGAGQRVQRPCRNRPRTQAPTACRTTPPQARCGGLGAAPPEDPCRTTPPQARTSNNNACIRKFVGTAPDALFSCARAGLGSTIPSHGHIPVQDKSSGLPPRLWAWRPNTPSMSLVSVEPLSSLPVPEKLKASESRAIMIRAEMA